MFCVKLGLLAQGSLGTTRVNKLNRFLSSRTSWESVTCCCTLWFSEREFKQMWFSKSMWLWHSFFQEYLAEYLAGHSLGSMFLVVWSLLNITFYNNEHEQVLNMTFYNSKSKCWFCTHCVWATQSQTLACSVSLNFLHVLGLLVSIPVIQARNWAIGRLRKLPKASELVRAGPVLLFQPGCWLSFKSWTLCSLIQEAFLIPSPSPRRTQTLLWSPEPESIKAYCIVTTMCPPVPILDHRAHEPQGCLFLGAESLISSPMPGT